MKTIILIGVILMASCGGSGGGGDGPSTEARSTDLTPTVTLGERADVSDDTEADPIVLSLPTMPAGQAVYWVDDITVATGAYMGREGRLSFVWDGERGRWSVPAAWDIDYPANGIATVVDDPWLRYQDEAGSFRFHDIAVSAMADGRLVLEITAWANERDNVVAELSVVLRELPQSAG